MDPRCAVRKTRWGSHPQPATLYNRIENAAIEGYEVSWPGRRGAQGERC
jgi:hypothetical protein